VPYLDESVILGGAHFPTVGVVDSLRAGTLMREQAQQLGALRVLAGTEVLGIDTGADGRVSAVRTSKGDIATEVCAICCGVWSPRIARMAGARIPLTPIVHQMISVGPIPLFADTPGEISYPIVRDVDTNMYERQHGGDMEVGSYAHRPIIIGPNDIPSIEEAVLSPTELPFTQDDFDPQLLQALELMPDLLGDERVGIRYAINGLISMTPDGHPLLGETPEVPGLWSVAASWIKEGPGIGRAVAEWMCGETPEIDIHEADIARFYGHQRTTAHVTARAREGFNKMYGIVHPAEQWESERRSRLSPVYDRERELGAVFIETAGWERPNWYDSNSGLLQRYAGRLMEREAEWEARWWSPIINAEHLAMRDACGLVDLSAFAVFDVTGPGALEAVQAVAVAQMDVRAGRVVYTSLLDERGGFRGDLTIMRLGPQRFRVVTGGATGMARAERLCGLAVAAVLHCDAHALPEQRFGDAVADPRRSAGHERRASGQVTVISQRGHRAVVAEERAGCKRGDRLHRRSGGAAPSEGCEIRFQALRSLSRGHRDRPSLPLGQRARRGLRLRCLLR